jgi:hypothetical protein
VTTPTGDGKNRNYSTDHDHWVTSRLLDCVGDAGVMDCYGAS